MYTPSGKTMSALDVIPSACKPPRTTWKPRAENVQMARSSALSICEDAVRGSLTSRIRWSSAGIAPEEAERDAMLYLAFPLLASRVT